MRTTLLPATVILTGTPHNVGMGQNPPRWPRHGNYMNIAIEKIGKLANSGENEKSETNLH